MGHFRLSLAATPHAGLLEGHDRVMSAEHPGTLQRVAMRLVGDASAGHESVFGGPQGEDSRCRPPAWDVQRRGGPYFWGWRLMGQTLCQEGRKGRVAGSCEGTGQGKEPRREQGEVTRRGPA